MGKQRFELDAMLVELEHQMPGLIVKFLPEEETFFKAFSGLADPIAVRTRINCILGSFGLIPSDNEGEPCDAQQFAES